MAMSRGPHADRRGGDDQGRLQRRIGRHLSRSFSMTPFGLWGAIAGCMVSGPLLFLAALQGGSNRGVKLLAGPLVFALGLLLLLLKRWSAHAEQAQRHRVSIFLARPSDADSYYIALCECDWFGEARGTAAEAVADGYTHSPEVEESVKEPSADRQTHRHESQRDI